MTLPDGLELLLREPRGKLSYLILVIEDQNLHREDRARDYAQIRSRVSEAGGKVLRVRDVYKVEG